MRAVFVGVSSSRSERAPQHANRANCVPGGRISSVFPNTGAANGLYLMSARIRVLERPLTGEPSRLLSRMYKCHGAKGLYAPVPAPAPMLLFGGSQPAGSFTVILFNCKIVRIFRYYLSVSLKCV